MRFKRNLIAILLSTVTYANGAAVTDTVPEGDYSYRVETLEIAPEVNINVRRFDTIDSTQKYARRHREELSTPESIVALIAEEQGAGIGRTGSWVSDHAGKDILVTYVTTFPQKNARLLPCLPQVTAVSVAQVLETYGLNIKIKWMNDVLSFHTEVPKKICGILCEAESHSDDNLSLLIGVGINVNRPQEAFVSVDQPATSMFAETGETFDKEQIFQEFSRTLFSNIDRLKRSGFSSFHEYIERHLAFKGQEVIITDVDSGEETGRGKVVGINTEHGFLITSQTHMGGRLRLAQ